MFPKPSGKHKVYHANKPEYAKKEQYGGIPLEVRQEVVERSMGICEGMVARTEEGGYHGYSRTLLPRCANVATDMAHIEPKRMGGSRKLDTANNLLHLCRRCHDYFDGR